MEEAGAPDSSSESDVSELLPRRLRYSEALFPIYFCDDADSSILSATSAAALDKRPLKVYARLKPATLSSGQDKVSTGTTSSDLVTGSTHGVCIQATATDITLRMRDGNSTSFSFDRVFEGLEQKEILQTAVEPLVDELASLRTASSVFMSYGASGTGKSYTIQGTPEQPGMVPHAIHRLFQVLVKRGLNHEVQLSYFELDGNQVTDLLHPLQQAREKAGRQGAGVGAAAGGKPNPPQHSQQQFALRIGAGFFLPNLLRCHISTAHDGMALFAAAVRLRRKEATRVNSESSRSHAVFTIHLVETEQGPGRGRSAMLSLVDLAGMERATQTHHVGKQLRESAGINSSLSVLRRCLEALRHNQALDHRAATTTGGGTAAAPPGPRLLVPVRESGLTSLFAAVLSGQGNLTLSVHVSALAEDYALTLESLRFGALAAKVTMNAVAPEALSRPPPALAPVPMPLVQLPRPPPPRGAGAATGTLRVGHCARPPAGKGGGAMTEQLNPASHEQAEVRQSLQIQQQNERQQVAEKELIELEAAEQEEQQPEMKAGVMAVDDDAVHVGWEVPAPYNSNKNQDSNIDYCDIQDGEGRVLSERANEPMGAVARAARPAAALVRSAGAVKGESELSLKAACDVAPHLQQQSHQQQQQQSHPQLVKQELNGGCNAVHSDLHASGEAGGLTRVQELEQLLQQERDEKQALRQELQVALSALSDLKQRHKRVHQEIQRLRAQIQHEKKQLQNQGLQQERQAQHDLYKVEPGMSCGAWQEVQPPLSTRPDVTAPTGDACRSGGQEQLDEGHMAGGCKLHHDDSGGSDIISGECHAVRDEGEPRDCDNLQALNSSIWRHQQQGKDYPLTTADATNATTTTITTSIVGVNTVLTATEGQVGKRRWQGGEGWKEDTVGYIRSPHSNGCEKEQLQGQGKRQRPLTEAKGGGCAGGMDDNSCGRPAR